MEVDKMRRIEEPVRNITYEKKLKKLEKLKELNIKIGTYLKLKKFCQENSTKCFNKNKNCDECSIQQLIDELEEQIFLEA